MKRAPLPPTSTPLSQKTQNENVEFEVSPVIKQFVNDKEAKDEENRNRQSAISDKSMYGKWKRKKGPAPSRPVPQRRTIKCLPLSEIRRELDLIEIQQQGLEKQGVKLEQIIREKTETTTGDMGKKKQFSLQQLPLLIICNV